MANGGQVLVWFAVAILLSGAKGEGSYASFVSPLCPLRHIPGCRISQGDICLQREGNPVGEEFGLRRGFGTRQRRSRPLSFATSGAHRTRGGLREVSCVLDVEGTKTETEIIGELISKGEVTVKVREAKLGEGDAVALLRCRAFEQGKDVFRSQLIKMMNGGTKGNYLVAGRARTAFLVSSAEVVGDESRTCVLNLVLSDLDTLLEDGWVTPMEHSTRKRRLLSEWKHKAEIIIGSVDCAVHEFVSQDLMLVKSVYISSMAVRDGFRRMGIGERLLEGAHNLAVEYRVWDMFLHVEEDNVAAVKLYTKAGFKRADMKNQSTAYMDRALRLMLQVPVKAMLYESKIQKD